MEAYIVKIAPAAEGEEFALTIEITDEKGLRRENHCIAAQYFRETTLPSHIDAPYAADAELLSQIRYLSLCTAAIRGASPAGIFFQYEEKPAWQADTQGLPSGGGR